MLPNLFLKAIEKNEILDFALGKDDYLIPDREYGGHWILVCWQQHIIPALLQNNTISVYVKQLFLQLILNDKNNIDIQKSEALLYHLHVYYYFRKTGDWKIPDFLEDINGELNTTLVTLLSSNQTSERLSIWKKSIQIIRQNGGLHTFHLT